MLSVGLELKIKELRMLCRAGEVPVGFFFRFDSDATPMLIFKHLYRTKINNLHEMRDVWTCTILGSCKLIGILRVKTVWYVHPLLSCLLFYV